LVVVDKLVMDFDVILTDVEKLYIVLLLCDICMYFWPVLEALHPERQLKHAIYIYNPIYSSVN
jgi:hypothetical protein